MYLLYAAVIVIGAAMAVIGAPPAATRSACSLSRIARQYRAR